MHMVPQIHPCNVCAYYFNLFSTRCGDERIIPGNRNKGKGNGAGLEWESQSHCFADKFGKPYTHSFGTDTQHDYRQGNCRTMFSIIIKLE